MCGRMLVLAALLLTSMADGSLNAKEQQQKLVESSVPSKTDSGQPSSTPPDAGPPKPAARETRVLFITTLNSERCQIELAKLSRVGGDFDVMRARGWKIGPGAENHVQIIDRDVIPDLVRDLNVREFPTVACITEGKIVRAFKSGCTTPLDAWTFGWLYKGQNERPAASVLEPARVESTGSYRLRGNHWSVDGDWNPPKTTVVSHLRSPIHAYGLAANWRIENWSYEELRSLHDDLHEREMSSSAGFSSQPSRSSNSFDAGRKIKGT
jgi:hypothetical protein